MKITSVKKLDCWFLCNTQTWHAIDTWVIKANLLHYLSSVYFVIQTLHVSGIFVAHLQEVHSIYTTIGTCCATRTNCCVHSWQQKSIGLKFSKSQTGNDVRYSCPHNSSRFTFPIFAHSCRFSVLHSLQSITPRIY